MTTVVRNPVAQAFLDAANNLPALEALLAEHPNHATLSQRFSEYDGTLHYHCVDMAVLMARNDQTVAFAGDWVACATLLHRHHAPCEHITSTDGCAMALLDSDWSSSAHSELIGSLLAMYTADGTIRPHVELPHTHATLAGLLPLACAFKTGNAVAARVLLQGGHTPEEVLQGTPHSDVLEYAASFCAPGTPHVVAVLTQHLLERRLSVVDAPASQRRRAARAL